MKNTNQNTNQNKQYEYTLEKLLVVIGFAVGMVILFSPCIFATEIGTAHLLLCFWMFKEFYRLFKWVGARRVAQSE